MAQKAGILKIRRSTEVSEAAAVAEVMIVGDSVENTEVKILTLTILRALSVTCSETARSSKRLEISGTEEKKTQEKEKKKKEKKKRGQRIFLQDDRKGTLFSGSSKMRLLRNTAVPFLWHFFSN